MRAYSKADSKISLISHSNTFIFAILWFMWLLGGTIFYKYDLDMPWGKGFYMAVNIGYSIGWGDIIENSHSSKLFSIVYVIIGASFVGAGLAFFAATIVKDKDSWYVNELQRIEHDDNADDNEGNIFRIFLGFVKYNLEKFRIVGIFVCFILFGTIATFLTISDFNFIDALYFSVSSLSTGGHESLPANRSEFIYTVTGLFCAVGVPVMGAAMAAIASFFVNTGGDIHEAIEQIRAPIGVEEVELLTEFGKLSI